MTNREQRMAEAAAVREEYKRAKRAKSKARSVQDARNKKRAAPKTKAVEE